MYNILLTDDEQIVIDSLTIILTRNFGDEVKIFSALSGTKALEILRQEKIDIAFMDMHMPGINGLETISLAKQINPNLVIVILSAYDQFQYAQEALNLGVLKYLTKPVNRNVIVSTVRNCMDVVDSKASAVSNNLELHEKLNSVSSIVESDFIYSCIFNNSDADFSSYIEYFELEDSLFFMCCFEFSELNQNNRYEVYLKVRDVLTTKSKCIIGSFMANRIGVFISLPKSDLQNLDFQKSELSKSELEKKSALKDFQQLQQNLIKEIYSILAINLSCKIKIGVGRIESSILNAAGSYNNALTAINQINDESGVSFFDEEILQDENVDVQKKFSALNIKLENSIKLSAPAVCKEIILEYVDLLFETYNQNVGILKFRLAELIFKIKFFTEQVVENYSNCAFENVFTFVAAVKIDEKSKSEIAQLICDIALDCVSSISVQSKKKINPIILRAYDYIEKNLSKDFGLDELANALSVSSFYLSKLFKEETGKTFVSYLTDLRLEKAKKLLNDKSLFIKEITMMVGYNDQNYFSKLFKTRFGISPTDYRDSIM